MPDYNPASASDDLQLPECTAHTGLKLLTRGAEAEQGAALDTEHELRE